jgi:hypothetical protein
VTMNNAEKIEMENVNHSGHVKLVDAGMYEAMKRGAGENQSTLLAESVMLMAGLFPSSARRIERELMKIQRAVVDLRRPASTLY